MNPIDLTIFVVYMIGMLGVGYYFLRQNKDNEDYYVGGRSMGSVHVGLSVVATDVGGGFSIGLGGLGFTMGLSGSWMLFTGLVGAWLSAVVLVPVVARLAKTHRFTTFPEILDLFYNKKVAFIAAIISGIGYLGFTSSQILAGAKLASATFVDLDLNTALIAMGIIAVVYTVLGGIKAVIYTDTIQWSILMIGLIFIGIPMSYNALGGYDGIAGSVSADMLSLGNLQWQDLVNWAVTIIPIWFIGMTLYQRIYACRDEHQARKAWFIAGLFEYPIMAFLGVLLGLFSRVALEQGMFAEDGYTTLGSLDPEMGLPLLLKTILPAGLMGLMMSAYFSAIMSTADSCLMAASGNIVTDIIGKFIKLEESQMLRFSQWATLVVGAVAILLAATMTNVLDLMLLSYAFMVSGLLIPVLVGFYGQRKDPTAAIAAMLLGGCTTLFLEFSTFNLPYGLDPNLGGLTASALVFFTIAYAKPRAMSKQKQLR